MEGPSKKILLRLLLSALLATVLAATTFAAIIDQPMTGPTAPGWVFGGTPNPAVLTGNGTIDPVGNGWLRLTSTATDQAGYAYFNSPFDITNGVVIQFDYTTWGGSGADGYSIFLFDGATSPFQIGASGGSLGYAQKTIAPISPGLSGGYIGVGIDEFGNFSAATEGRVGGPGARPQSVAVRGPASTSWAYVGGTAANVGQLWFNQATRPGQTGPQYRKVVIYLTPVAAPDYLRVDVYLQFGYNQPLTQVLNGLMVGQAPPATVKVGYAASTGGSTNYHEIRNLLINPLQNDINLAIFKSTATPEITVGSNLTYTVTARNYGPNMVTATNTPIIDNVPTELTSVTWTCATTGGATCGAASGSGNTINTTATLPFNGAATYTISGTLASAPASSTISNTASLTVPVGVVDYNLADNSSTATVRVLSDLSTSSKTVVDLNGGDVEVGDILRYTVTLNETAAFGASGVRVTDNIPANVNNFSVVSFPAGASNNSTGAGTGTNGSGYLDISNISVPANGSRTIVFDVTVNGAPGATIANTATISNPGGSGGPQVVNRSAPTLTIAGGSLPGSGNKPLYLYDSASTPATKLSRTPMAVTPASFVTIPRGNVTQTWTLSPALQAAVTIGSGTIPVQLWLSTSITNRTYSIPVTLRCGATSVATLTQNAALVAGAAPTLFTFNLPRATPYTCASGSTWSLDVTNTQATGAGARDIQVSPAPAAASYSNVSLPSQSVININNADIALYNAAYPGGSTVATVNAGSTVYIRAIVSDPFGSYDISGATITLTDAAGTVQVNAAAMTQVFDSGGATKTYQYAYSVPSAGPGGNWSIRVVTREGTEGTVSDYALARLPVQIPQPLISILKSADAAIKNPGDVISYRVQIANSGAGPGTSVVLTDSLSSLTAWSLNAFGAGVPFQFIDGAPASGMTLGTPVFSNDGGTTYAYTPVSGGGGAPAGYDGTVTNWRIPMTGTIRSGGGITINYKAVVK